VVLVWGMPPMSPSGCHLGATSPPNYCKQQPKEPAPANCGHHWTTGRAILEGILWQHVVSMSSLRNRRTAQVDLLVGAMGKLEPVRIATANSECHFQRPTPGFKLALTVSLGFLESAELPSHLRPRSSIPFTCETLKPRYRKARR
jgi:hypothetical protein